MFWRIIGIASLGWGGVVFYILSTTKLAASTDVSLYPTLELTIYVLSLTWLIASSLVKVGLILKKRWLRLSMISCICFVFLLINMGLAQMSLGSETPPPAGEPLYPYNLAASWFVSWFWIDLFLLMTQFFEWMIKKRMSH